MPLKQNRVIVHLGNLGPSKIGIKTERLSKRFPNIQFTGIDVEAFESSHGNWVQLKDDFESGLSKIHDNSIFGISSELALGHYLKNGEEVDNNKKGLHEYTNRVVDLCYRKLSNRGRLNVSVTGDKVKFLLPMLKRIFGGKNIIVREFRENEYQRTNSTGEYRNWGVKLYHITAEKNLGL